MGIFSGKPTLETRLSALCAALATSFNLSEDQAAQLNSGDLAPITDAITAAESRVTELEGQVTEARDAAVNEQNLRTESDRIATEAQTTLTDFRASLQSALAIDDTQLASLVTGDLTVIASAVTDLAGRRAVELAAAQGCPPLITDSSLPGASEEDAIKAIRDQASAERDPQKRAALHAKATNLKTEKKNAHRN